MPEYQLAGCGPTSEPGESGKNKHPLSQYFLSWCKKMIDRNELVKLINEARPEKEVNVKIGGKEVTFKIRAIDYGQWLEANRKASLGGERVEEEINKWIIYFGVVEPKLNPPDIDLLPLDVATVLVGEILTLSFGNVTEITQKK